MFASHPVPAATGAGSFEPTIVVIGVVQDHGGWTSRVRSSAPYLSPIEIRISVVWASGI